MKVPGFIKIVTDEVAKEMSAGMGGENPISTGGDSGNSAARQ